MNLFGFWVFPCGCDAVKAEREVLVEVYMMRIRGVSMLRTPRLLVYSSYFGLKQIANLHLYTKFRIRCIGSGLRK